MHAEAVFYNKMEGHFRHLTASGKRRATAPLPAALAPKRALWPVRFSAMLGVSAAAPPHMWKELGPRRARCAMLPRSRGSW
jgi:hypothetical protein